MNKANPPYACGGCGFSPPPVYAGFYFCRKNFAIAKSSIMSSMEIGRADVAHLFTAYLAAYMLGQFLTGFMGRRVATRMLLLTN